MTRSILVSRAQAKLAPTQLETYSPKSPEEWEFN